MKEGIHRVDESLFNRIGICVKLWTQETLLARLLGCDTGEAARFFLDIF